MGIVRERDPLKVGLVIYGRLDQASGGYLYDRMLVNALRRRGHCVDVISLPSCRRDGDDAHLRERMEEQDVVVQDELCHPSLLRLDRTTRPVVALVHNLTSCLIPSDEGVRAAERHYLQSVDRAVCTSRATLEACRSLCPHLPPATVVRPGKDHLMPRPRRPGAGRLRILHVGNLHPTKGLDVLLQALGSLSFPPFSLEVAGAASDKAFVRRLGAMMDRSLRERAHFLGAVPPQEMVEVYRQADVLAVPSRYEGYGIALIEAMGFGIPIIAGREGGAGELITHGREGFLVPAGDSAAVAGHLGSLVDDGLRAKMGLRARQRWGELPTWEESMDRLVDLIESERNGADRSSEHP